MMKTLPLCALLSGITALAAADGPSVDVVGGTYRMFTVGEQPEVVVRGPTGSKVRLSSRDIFGVAEDWKHEVTLANGEGRVQGPGGVGYHRITATSNDGTNDIDFGVVPVQAPGSRPESLFASNTSGVRTGDELELLVKLGVRVQRGHFMGDGGCAPTADGSPAKLDYTRLDSEWGAAKAAGSWFLPCAGYAFPNGLSPMAVQAKMYGPPRDNSEFCSTWELTLRRYPEVTTYEFWNEPWIYGWTWAADPATYRTLQRQWCDMALAVNPKLRLIAGNSVMFWEDHIEDYPESWKGVIQGLTHHPYCGGGHPTMRGGGQQRTIDHGFVATQRCGLPYYYLTEGGSEFRDQKSLGDERNNPENARKAVQYTVHAALGGCYQSNMQWDIGYGPIWTIANTTLATLASLIEDRPCVADIWPQQSMLWGAVFANPRHLDAAVRALPRAKELEARWTVAIPDDRRTDATKVAVIFCNTGASNQQLDTTGTLTIADATGITALDATGRAISAVGKRLVVPFNEWPVYLTSDTLSVIDLRQRIADAEIGHVTALNLSACSLEQPADQKQTLRVRLENQVNRPLTGTLSVTVAGGKPWSAPFTATAGQLIDVAIPWAGTKIDPDNRYGVTITATTPAGTVTRQQAIAVARCEARTITVDGDLADWAGSTPVVLDSDQLKGGIDLTQYLLNPNLTRPTDASGGERVVARLTSAWDDTNVYIAVAVHERTLKNIAGTPVKRGDAVLPYRAGMPDGLDHIRYTGDSLMLTFGFRDRVPGWGRQMNDPWAWKGYFCDSDYHYVAHVDHEGAAHIVRLWGADTPRRNAYQTVAESFSAAIPGAKVAIKRDEVKLLTTYELAIPRSELKLFDPAAPRLRLAFNLVTDAAVNGSQILRWGEAAGVFDHWYTLGSFSPTWEENLPCQTFFALGKR